MRILSGRSAEAFVRKLERRGPSALASVEKPVRRIINDVRRDGDRALRRYAEKWDGLEPRQPPSVSPSEMLDAWNKASGDLKHALKVAAANIRQYCEWQKPKAWTNEASTAVELSQVCRPLRSVGCYVPGGRYPLPSTLLMTVIPAQVAGVKEIRVVSPRPTLATLAAAYVVGVREFYRTGGAQGIAALAYGTRSIPRVDKIVGPGNLFVTAAKRAVAFDCSIDMLAGPTEAVIVSDRGNATFIAADLIAQAEHDPEACSVFITGSRELAASVEREVELFSAGNPIARLSLKKNGAIIVAGSITQAMEFANRIAPEHITVDADNVDAVENAGSIFVGDYSAQAAGDYASGPNHVLPTGGAARFRAGLNVLDFVKVISVQRLSSDGLSRLAPTIVALAEAEGLKAHAQSIRLRCARA